MKGAVETFLSIIMITFMAVLSTSYITASLNTRKAQNYHAAVITEIEASDFSDEVIGGCINNAKKNGYVLEDGSSGLSIQKTGTLQTAEVILKYRYSIPLLNMNMEHEIKGYAR